MNAITKHICYGYVTESTSIDFVWECKEDEEDAGKGEKLTERLEAAS